jgi:hypothetical protein
MPFVRPFLTYRFRLHCLGWVSISIRRVIPTANIIVRSGERVLAFIGGLCYHILDFVFHFCIVITIDIMLTSIFCIRVSRKMKQLVEKTSDTVIHHGQYSCSCWWYLTADHCNYNVTNCVPSFLDQFSYSYEAEY